MIQVINNYNIFVSVKTKWQLHGRLHEICIYLSDLMALINDQVNLGILILVRN
jgi:hypothetical protein